MDIRTKEAVRYLGYGDHAIDERTKKLIQDSFEELEAIAEVRFVYRIFEILLRNKNELNLGDCRIKSSQLFDNLKDCKEVVLFAVTLGVAVDLQLKRYTVTDMARAVVFQACAAAYLEEACDQCQSQIENMLDEGQYLRPRFSPGYGDFSILHQSDILQMLDVTKKIGVSMTDGYMLTPTKSVTAIMGITNDKRSCPPHSCDGCSKTDCIYKRS